MDDEKKKTDTVLEGESDGEPISASGYLRSSAFRRDKDYPDYKKE